MCGEGLQKRLPSESFSLSILVLSPWGGERQEREVERSDYRVCSGVSQWEATAKAKLVKPHEGPVQPGKCLQRQQNIIHVSSLTNTYQPD